MIQQIQMLRGNSNLRAIERQQQSITCIDLQHFVSTNDVTSLKEINALLFYQKHLLLPLSRLFSSRALCRSILKSNPNPMQNLLRAAS